MIDYLELCRNEYGVCKACSIERGTNTEGATRAGRKMAMVRIINISSEMIGIGRRILPSETEGLTTAEKLPKKILAIHYHITTQCWALTGRTVAYGHVCVWH